MNRLLHAFRTQYAPIQNVFKAEVKALRQQPGQTIRSFFRELRGWARKAYLVEVVRNEILITIFFAVLFNPTVGSEVRNAKPADADAALQAALKTCSLREIDGSKMQTSGANNSSTETPLGTFTELVRSLRTRIQDAVAPSGTDNSAFQNNQIDRFVSQNSHRHMSASPGPRQKNNFSNFKKLNQPKEQNTARNSNNQHKNSKYRFPDKSISTKRDQRSNF